MVGYWSFPLFIYYLFYNLCNLKNTIVQSENWEHSKSIHNKQTKDDYWDNVSQPHSEGSKCQCGKGIIRYVPCMTGKKCR